MFFGWETSYDVSKSHLSGRKRGRYFAGQKAVESLAALHSLPFIDKKDGLAKALSGLENKSLRWDFISTRCVFPTSSFS